MALRTFVPLDVTPLEDMPFAGLARSQQAGTMQIAELHASPHLVRRTTRLISADGRDYYKLSLQVHGRCVLAQDGRESVLEPGDIAIYDATRPYQLAFTEPCQLLVFMFPRSTLPIPAATLAGITATRICGQSGLGALTGAFFRKVGSQLDGLSETTCARLAENVLELATTLFLDRLESTSVRPESLQRALALRIRAFIEMQLADPDLTPESVARAHHISTRYLYKLFEQDGSSVARYVRERRLEHCRLDLLEPRLRGNSVSSIAARWGLLDAAHFSKLFHAAYGVSPRRYRLSAATSGAAPTAPGSSPAG